MEQNLDAEYSVACWPVLLCLHDFECPGKEGGGRGGGGGGGEHVSPTQSNPSSLTASSFLRSNSATTSRTEGTNVCGSMA